MKTGTWTLQMRNSNMCFARFTVANNNVKIQAVWGATGVVDKTVAIPEARKVWKELTGIGFAIVDEAAITDRRLAQLIRNN